MFLIYIQSSLLSFNYRTFSTSINFISWVVECTQVNRNNSTGLNISQFKSLKIRRSTNFMYCSSACEMFGRWKIHATQLLSRKPWKINNKIIGCWGDSWCANALFQHLAGCLFPVFKVLSFFSGSRSNCFAHSGLDLPLPFLLYFKHPFLWTPQLSYFLSPALFFFSLLSLWSGEPWTFAKRSICQTSYSLLKKKKCRGKLFSKPTKIIKKLYPRLFYFFELVTYFIDPGSLDHRAGHAAASVVSHEYLGQLEAGRRSRPPPLFLNCLAVSFILTKRGST